MHSPKKLYLLNHYPGMNAPVSVTESENAGFMGEWKGQGVSNVPPASQVIESRDRHGGQQDSSSSMERRSVDVSLPVQDIQLSSVPASVPPSLTFGVRQVVDQRLPCNTDRFARIFDTQKKVEMRGEKFEEPIENKRRFDIYQQEELNNSFRGNNLPTDEKMGALGKKIGVEKPQVALFSENRNLNEYVGLSMNPIVSSAVSGQPGPSSEKRMRQQGGLSERHICLLEKRYEENKNNKNVCSAVSKLFAEETGVSRHDAYSWLFYRNRRNININRNRKRCEERVTERDERDKTDKKISRVPFERFMIRKMEKMFENNIKVTGEEADALADQFSVDRNKIIRWFAEACRKLKQKYKLSALLASSKSVLAKPDIPSEFFGFRWNHKSKQLSRVPEASNKIGEPSREFRYHLASEFVTAMPSALGASLRSAEQRVDRTAPTAALGAPLRYAEQRVDRTAPTAALGAPLPSTEQRVDRTVPTAALGAPLPSAEQRVDRTVPTAALGAPLRSAEQRVDRTAPTAALGAPLPIAEQRVDRTVPTAALGASIADSE